MLVAAAVCPCPPVIVPEVAAGAADELDSARAACTQAVGVLAAARPDRLVVVGPTVGDGRQTYPEGTPGSFRGFGVERGVSLGRPARSNVAGAGAGAGGGPGASAVAAEGAGSGAGPGAGTGTEAVDAPSDAHGDRSGPPGAYPNPLPPSLAVAAWLLGHARWPSVPVSAIAVGELLSAERCTSTGREIAEGPERVAVLAMGDASARRSLKAPGYFDERAADFDARAARALAQVDVAALAAVDERLAAELQAAGRAPWQVLAGAATSTDLHGTLLYDAAPYGVGYLVAAWS